MFYNVKNDVYDCLMHEQIHPIQNKYEQMEQFNINYIHEFHDMVEFNLHDGLI